MGEQILRKSQRKKTISIYCLVPKCANTNKRTPHKLFISFPNKNQPEKRKLWLKAMRRNENDISKKTEGYVCEDHFDLKEDMVNYLKWMQIGGNIFLKDNVVPHIFKSRKRSLKQTESQKTSTPLNVHKLNMKLMEEEKEVCTAKSISENLSSKSVDKVRNEDLLSDDSRSNAESLAGVGDLLVENTNPISNECDDYERNRADDTRSWSSNSSNFPPTEEIDDISSDEMILRLSEEDDEDDIMRNGELLVTQPAESNEKCNNEIPNLSSSPLPIKDLCIPLDNNPFQISKDEESVQSFDNSAKINTDSEFETLNQFEENEKDSKSTKQCTEIVDQNKESITKISIYEISEEIEELIKEKEIHENSGCNNNKDIELGTVLVESEKSKSNQEINLESSELSQKLNDRLKVSDALNLESDTRMFTEEAPAPAVDASKEISSNANIRDTDFPSTELLTKDSKSLAKDSESLAKDSESIAKDSVSLEKDSESLAKDSESLAKDSESLSKGSESPIIDFQTVLIKEEFKEINDLQKNANLDKIITNDEKKEELKEAELHRNLKRPRTNSEEVIDENKKAKINEKESNNNIKKSSKREYIPLNFFREFMSKKEITTISRSELEELCIQKMVEVVNQNSKIGELNRTVKKQESVIEGLKTKYATLKKQVTDLTLVQNRITAEVKLCIQEGLNVKDITPIKITRSVGLQMNPTVLRNAMSSSSDKTSPSPTAVTTPTQKRKIQRTSLPNKLPSAQTPNLPNSPRPVGATIPKSANQITTNSKGIKTILPKVHSVPEVKENPSSNPNSPNSLLGSYLQNGTPSKVNKTTSTVATNNSVTRKPADASSATNKVIDLTDDEDKKPRAATSANTGIRIVGPQQLNNNSNQGTVTASMQRLTYLVSPISQGQQVLLATANTPTKPGQVTPTFMIKPVSTGQTQTTTTQRLNFVRPQNTVVVTNTSQQIRSGSHIRFQSSMTSRTQTSVRIVPRHPAPLPGPPAFQPSQPSWKAMPPKPQLKISRAGDGIVLSWKIVNKDLSMYEDIYSYQLYAYQETSNPPSTDNWRKVGDVKALALPMACTLTQFTDGNKYHFAVRAVDVKSRVGPFSHPEQIALP